MERQVSCDFRTRMNLTNYGNIRYYQTDEHAYKVLGGMGDVTKRKALRQELNCKSFNWFLDRFQDVFKSRNLLPMGNRKVSGSNPTVDVFC